MEASGVPQEDRHEPLAREGEHVAPAFKQKAFHCIHCGVLTAQEWEELQRMIGTTPFGTDCWECRCENCRKKSIWREITQGGRLIDPVVGGGPRPHPEMPDDVREEYEEAQKVVSLSPRGACALLRLAVQKLCADLGESGKDTNADIGNLVKGGLSSDVQEALDSLRVIGNNAVHPGEMDLKDDIETASALFDLLNFIVEDRIAQPKKRKALFERLPRGARDAIHRRDSDSKSAAPD